MSGFEVDLTGIITVWITGSILLVLAAGAVLRYGVAPVIGAVAVMRARTAGNCADGESELRLAEIEARLARLESATAVKYRSISDPAA